MEENTSMTDTSPEPGSHGKIDTSVPHSARIWNYWLGGKDNYPVDREAGDNYREQAPGVVDMARASRVFLTRAVRYVAAEEGVRQFLDVGTGLPVMDNTHQVAQRVAPDAKIVYVDNDPLVLVHARALLVNTTPEGVTAYVDADYHDPERIIADAANVLNLNLPVAVMFMGVLGYEPDFDMIRSIIRKVMAAVPSGSHLVAWDGTDTGEAVVEGGEKLVESGGVPYVLRAPEHLGGYFDDLAMVEPGLVPITRWRPEITGIDGAEHLDAYGAVARKP
jgi:S-adenosyl methyltransferase